MNDEQISFLRLQAQTTSFSQAFEVDRAEGCYIYGKDGKAYLDFVAGVSVNVLGHSHPVVNEAIIAQLKRHSHVMVYGEYICDSALDLCKLLADILPKPLETTYLLNSGTEAIEASLKLAKRYTGREHIVAFGGSYHGNTHGSMSVSGMESQKRAFRPLLPGVTFIPFNGIESLAEIDENTAAVIVETIQGAAGFVLPYFCFLAQLSAKCKEKGALLILDEIQPGFGRTGKMFAFEHYNIVPDILVMGKAMANGLPIGALSTSYALMSCLKENPILGHITTFGGNPVIAAAAKATLALLIKSNYMAEVAEKEALIREKLKHPSVIKIHGKGLMLAVELENTTQCRALVNNCFTEGLILFTLLYRSNFVRITPPLLISKEEINIGCSIILKELDNL